MAGGSFGGGDGTEENPFLVEDAADLNAIRGTTPGASSGAHEYHYKQVADIDCSSLGTVRPLPTPNDHPTTGNWSSFSEPRFTGTYDGQHYYIRNLSVKAYQAFEPAGMFCNIRGPDALVQRVQLIGIDVFNDGEQEQEEGPTLARPGCTGSIAGRLGGVWGFGNDGAIRRCSATGTVRVNAFLGQEEALRYQAYGGLVGSAIARVYIYDSWTRASLVFDSFSGTNDRTDTHIDDLEGPAYGAILGQNIWANNTYGNTVLWGSRMVAVNNIQDAAFGRLVWSQAFGVHAPSMRAQIGGCYFRGYENEHGTTAISTEAEMKDADNLGSIPFCGPSTVYDPQGYSNTWHIQPWFNDGYPHLQGEAMRVVTSPNEPAYIDGGHAHMEGRIAYINKHWYTSATEAKFEVASTVDYDDGVYTDNPDTTGTFPFDYSATHPVEAEGYEGDPIPIATESDLGKIGQGEVEMSDGHTYTASLFAQYKQMNDITLSSEWEPIGDHGAEDMFGGVYDGQGYAIHGLEVLDNGGSYHGFISAISTGTVRYRAVGIAHNDVHWGNSSSLNIDEGTVRNLTLTDAVVHGSWGVAGIAGYCEGRVENCHVTGEIGYDASPGWTWGAGGIVGESWGAYIADCTADVTMYGGGYSGGIVAEKFGGTILRCHSEGEIDTGPDTWGVYNGGVVGDSYDFGGMHTSIDQCSSTMFMNGHATGGGQGGLVGLAWGNVRVRNCYARGDVTGNWSNAGAFGEIGNGARVERCYSTGQITTDSGGGLIGQKEAGTPVVFCYYDYETSGKNDNDGRGEPRTTAEMTEHYMEEPVILTGPDFETTYRGWRFGRPIFEGTFEATSGGAFVYTGTYAEGWLSRGVEVGDSVIASGFEHAQNNGTFNVLAVNDILLTVDGELTAEGPGEGKRIEWAGPQIWWIRHNVNDGYPVLTEIPPDGELRGTIAAKAGAPVDLALFVKTWQLSGNIHGQSETWADLVELVKTLHLSGAIHASSQLYADLVYVSAQLWLSGAIHAESYFTIARRLLMWAKRDGVYEPVEAYAKSDGEYVPVQNLYHKVDGEYKE